MLNPNSKSGGLAYSEKSKVNHGNSIDLDALNDGFENDEVDVNPQDKSGNISNANKRNDKEREVPAAKPEKYDDLASSGT